MGEVQWIKLYLDIFDSNQKIKRLRRLPAGGDIVLIWIMLLVKAGRCNAGGHIFITESVPYTVEDLADEFKFDVSTIERALNSFSELDMIVVDDEGFIFITGWEEYQSADKLAELRAKDRERKRVKRAEAKALLGNSTTVHGQSTDSPRIEEDIEEEKEKEEESLSIVHSTREKEMTEEEKERIKRKYMGGTLGQNIVFLSDEQFADICDKLSIDEIDKYFGIIVDCERKGKRYKRKTHYQAILDMARKDRLII